VTVTWLRKATTAHAAQWRCKLRMGMTTNIVYTMNNALPRHRVHACATGHAANKSACMHPLQKAAVLCGTSYASILPPIHRDHLMPNAHVKRNAAPSCDRRASQTHAHPQSVCKNCKLLTAQQSGSRLEGKTHAQAAAVPAAVKLLYMLQMAAAPVTASQGCSALHSASELLRLSHTLHGGSCSATRPALGRHQ
jgi:hypothetical protein